MAYTLSNDIERLISIRLASGKYASYEAVLQAALHALAQDEQRGQFEAHEWDRLLTEGETGGESLDGDAVFDEIRQLRDQHPGSKA